jgi:hypothetical protein
MKDTSGSRNDGGKLQCNSIHAKPQRFDVIIPMLFRQVHGSIFSILRPDKTQLTSLNSYPAKAPSPVRIVGVGASRCPEERLSRGAPHLEQRLARGVPAQSEHPSGKHPLKQASAQKRPPRAVSTQGSSLPFYTFNCFRHKICRY